MKLSSYVNFRLGLALILTFSCATTGCRSSSWKMPSWKMPGSKFFSSGDPDPATLAGRSGVPELPESPATKYTASNIASAGKPAATTATTGTSGGTTNGTNSSLAGATNYGYPGPTTTQPTTTLPTTTLPTTTSPSTTSPTAGLAKTTPPTGLAALGNGYQTGPYQVGSNGGLATGATTGALASGPNGLPSPYGGTYAGASGAARTMTGNNSFGSPTATTLPALPDTSSASYAANINPAPGMMPQAGLPPLPTSLPSLPPPTGTMGSVEPSRAMAAGSYTLGGPSTTAGLASTSNPPSSAYQGATTQGFAPGTTGRSTTYNFSGTQSGNSAAGHNSLVPPSSSLPPNTATLPTAQPPRF